MSLSLSAEQKDLKALFLNDDKYLIPAFQRPYSWSDEELLQLYYDITTSFKRGEDYFLGSIMLAKSRRRKGVYEVVDGQQRLITLWLILKILSVIIPGISQKIRRMLMIDTWNDEWVPKIEWLDDMKDQNIQLRSIAEWKEEDFKTASSSQLSAMEEPEEEYKSSSVSIGQDTEAAVAAEGRGGVITQNARILFSYFNQYLNKLENSEKEAFRDYFVQSVYLLPIELSGDTDADAMSKALTVFETINDRGQELLDADIFKSRLYKMASSVDSVEEMQTRWRDIDAGCKDLNLTINDLFRVYSHIVRGRNSVLTHERGLREFFLLESYSPFLNVSYKKILDDLELILESLRIIRSLEKESTRVGAWLQILEAYSNRYPWYALVVYVFKHISQDSLEEEALARFIQVLVRYSYATGATSSVKFGIYAIITGIMKDHFIPERWSNGFNMDYFYDPGRLKKGLALLVFYLENPETGAVQDYKIDRILKEADYKWFRNNLSGSLSWWVTSRSLENYIVVTSTMRSVPFPERFEKIRKREAAAIRSQLPPDGNLTVEYFECRRVRITGLLHDFFKA